MPRCIWQVFTVVFIMEMVLKLIAFGIKEYCKNNWNLFDGTIVMLSVLDMVLTYTGAISGAGLSVLRTFRLVCSFQCLCTYTFTYTVKSACKNLVI